MPRPTKDNAEKRTERFNLRFTHGEVAHVHEQARTAGLGAHEYARRRVLGHRVTAAPARGDAALLTALNRAGVNLNQLARDNNSGEDVSREAGVVLAELRGIIDRLGVVLGS